MARPSDRYGNKRMSIKRHKLGSSRTAAYRKRRTAARAAQRARPRTAIKTAVGSTPNSHNFKRSYSHAFKLGTADAANGVLLNTDNRYMWLELHTKFNKMPDATEFKALFNQYKIYSVTHRFVPYNSINMPVVVGHANSLPNYELFIIPASFNQRKHTFSSMNSNQIDTWLNCSQRKARKLVPAKTLSFTSKHPKVVEYKGPLDKDAGTAAMTMASPSWYSTDSASLVAGGPNQTDVTHYTVQCLIRRVDGEAFGAQSTEQMGFRLENDVYFKTRQVQ